jgi:DNA-binding NtrC family response regulator
MGDTVLVVDDELSIRRVMAAQLGRRGYDVLQAPSGEDALATLSAQSVQVVVTDLRMSGMDGLELLDEIRRTHPAVPVILVTAYGTVDVAVEALKRGAFDFITKPFDQDDLLAAVEKAAATALRNETQLGTSLQASPELLGNSVAMRAVWKVIQRVAPSPSSVLVTGESGTGKELVARALHQLSGRAEAPFIQVSCGAIPERLFEVELFGRESIPGSSHAKPGRFELADGGTLFLDEVGALPRDMQVKVLHVLQGRPFERVGGTAPVSVDVRVVAATDIDLGRLVRDGGFREDLYYRLGVIPLRLAPLRERKEDLPALVDHFIGLFNERLGTTVTGMADDALDALQRHGWPGNLRELENLLERAMLLADGEELALSDLAGFRAEEDPLTPDARAHEDLDLKSYLRIHTERLERHRIRHALRVEEGNVTRAARRLGISRRSLQTKMKEYGLRDR